MAEDESLGSSFQHAARWRKWAAWGAQKAPDWFAVLAPPLIGAVFALVLPRARAAVLRNLRFVWGPRDFLWEAWDVAATFAHFARNLAGSLAPEREVFATKRFWVRGRHRAQQALDRRTGVLFVTAHVGPWDAAAMALQSMGDGPVMMLMSRDADAKGGALQDAVRKSERLSVLRVGGSPLDALPTLEHLRSGGVVVAQMDRPAPSGRAITGELLGQSFDVPRGLFVLSGATEAPLVPVFSARRSRGRCLVQVGEPIFVPKRPSESELSFAAQKALNQLAAHLQAFADQWFHFEDEPG